MAHRDCGLTKARRIAKAADMQTSAWLRSWPCTRLVSRPGQERGAPVDKAIGGNREPCMCVPFRCSAHQGTLDVPCSMQVQFTYRMSMCSRALLRPLSRCGTKRSCRQVTDGYRTLALHQRSSPTVLPTPVNIHGITRQTQ